MGFLKKQRIGFIPYIIVAVMAIVTLSVYISNVNAPYYEDMRMSVVWMMIGALVSILIALILPQFSGSKAIKFVTDVFRVITAVLIIWAGVTFIDMRLESFGYIFGSNLELGNEAAYEAGTQAVMGIILFVITWVLSIIVSFLDVGKKAH